MRTIASGKSTKAAPTHRHPDGVMHALSSDGFTCYRIVNRPDGTWSCDCPAGRNGRACYHAHTASSRYPGFNPRPRRTAKPAGVPCFVCGQPNANAAIYYRVAGNNYVERPCCADGSGHMAAQTGGAA